MVQVSRECMCHYLIIGVLFIQGRWPYTYDACDVGAAPNQTINSLPLAATINGDQSVGGALSFLPGQRLSRCTCPGESHPGPVHSDGTYVGRSAPEIDIFEAQVSGGAGQVSQSAQWAVSFIITRNVRRLTIPSPSITNTSGSTQAII